jgi:hypothetical protein
MANENPISFRIKARRGWSCFGEYFVEPIVIPLYICLLFIRLQNVASSIPKPFAFRGLFSTLGADMMANIVVLGGGLIIFEIWWYSRKFRNMRDARQQNESLVFLRAIAYKLGVSEDEIKSARKDTHNP